MRTIYISKDDLHVSAWLWTLPLTEEKKERLSLCYRRRRTQEHVDFLRRRQQCSRSFFSFKGMPLRGS